MSTALDKAKAENKALRESATKRSARMRLEKSAVLNEACGQLGQLTGAVATAAVDAKWSPQPGDMAKFGQSSIPAAPTVGFVVALGSLALVKASPKLAAFVGRAGMEAAYIGVYHGARDKFVELFA